MREASLQDPGRVQTTMGSRLCAIALALGLALGCLLPAGEALAERRALLIGVSSYPSLPKDRDHQHQLEGPKNDVPMVRDLLKRNGFAEAEIRVLADQVPGAALPTRAAILAQLKSLAERAQKGDFIYLHFSGHGSQQPTRPGKPIPELDGLDETFLPQDIGKWGGVDAPVENAIVDYEMGDAITAVRAKGAFVWAVFDSCHSGGVTRGPALAEDVRERRVDPTTLGIPQKVLDEARKRAPATRGGSFPEKHGALGDGAIGKGLGGYVYFYAARQDERAEERRLPPGQPGRVSHGALTFMLSQVIASNPGISYRQAGERIQQLALANNDLSATPLFEGSGLDAPLFGQKPHEAVRQWPVSASEGGFAIEAGTLHQFGIGAIFALYRDAAAKPEEVLGYLKADTVSAMHARLAPIALNGKPALSSATLPRDAMVRLVNPALNLTLRVAMPGEGATQRERERAIKIIERIKAKPPDGVKLEWVSARESADVRLAIADQQIWLLSANGAWIKSGVAKALSIGLDKPEDALYKDLGETLQRIAKATNLQRIAAQTQAGGLYDKVEMQFAVTRAKGGKREEISASAVPKLEAGDRVHLSLRNRKGYFKELDVTVLSIDSRYGITLLYPLPGDGPNRITRHDKLDIPPIKIGDRTVGRESIIVIAVEARPKTEPMNLEFLAQASLDASRTGSADPLTDLFLDAGFGGERTRGLPDITLDRALIRTFTWVTQAAQ